MKIYLNRMFHVVQSFLIQMKFKFLGKFGEKFLHRNFVAIVSSNNDTSHVGALTEVLIFIMRHDPQFVVVVCNLEVGEVFGMSLEVGWGWIKVLEVSI